MQGGPGGFDGIGRAVGLAQMAAAASAVLCTAVTSAHRPRRARKVVIGQYPSKNAEVKKGKYEGAANGVNARNNRNFRTGFRTDPRNRRYDRNRDGVIDHVGVLTAYSIKYKAYFSVEGNSGEKLNHKNTKQSAVSKYVVGYTSPKSLRR
ncbi:hypothetical protein ACFVH0_12335 [Streptomyces sp. NPDC127117]|uniref:hypothetical protein n=1 Tax=Streptomyces sp. NPDC127117 TaxID=3345368 RepID=UPI003635E8BC